MRITRRPGYWRFGIFTLYSVGQRRLQISFDQERLELWLGSFILYIDR